MKGVFLKQRISHRITIFVRCMLYYLSIICQRPFPYITQQREIASHSVFHDRERTNIQILTNKTLKQRNHYPWNSFCSAQISIDSHCNECRKRKSSTRSYSSVLIRHFQSFLKAIPKSFSILKTFCHILSILECSVVLVRSRLIVEDFDLSYFRSTHLWPVAMLCRSLCNQYQRCLRWLRDEIPLHGRQKLQNPSPAEEEWFRKTLRFHSHQNSVCQLRTRSHVFPALPLKIFLPHPAYKCHHNLKGRLSDSTYSPCYGNVAKFSSLNTLVLLLFVDCSKSTNCSMGFQETSISWCCLQLE